MKYLGIFTEQRKLRRARQRVLEGARWLRARQGDLWHVQRRFTTRFAWLPTRVEDGQVLWLEPFMELRVPVLWERYPGGARTGHDIRSTADSDEDYRYVYLANNVNDLVFLKDEEALLDHIFYNPEHRPRTYRRRVDRYRMTCGTWTDKPGYIKRIIEGGYRI